MKRVAFSYGCLMANLPPDLAEGVRRYASKIPTELLVKTEDATTGVPDDIHITIKYGLLTDNPMDVADVIVGTEPIVVKLGGASIFHNEKEAVLKLLVQSAGLKALHHKVCNGVDTVNTHGEYKPHVTVAYLVKKDDDPYYYREFFSDEFEGMEFVVDRTIFSTKGGQKSIISFNGDVIPMNEIRASRIAKSIVADYRDATLEDLKGGVQFVPVFAGGKSFIITADGGIYVRGPYGSADFRRIDAIRHAVMELGLSDYEDASRPFLYFGGNYQKLIQDLISSKKFHVKRIT